MWEIPTLTRLAAMNFLYACGKTIVRAETAWTCASCVPDFHPQPLVAIYSYFKRECGRLMCLGFNGVTWPLCQSTAPPIDLQVHLFVFFLHYCGVMVCILQTWAHTPWGCTVHPGCLRLTCNPYAVFWRRKYAPFAGLPLIQCGQCILRIRGVLCWECCMDFSALCIMYSIAFTPFGILQYGNQCILYI